MFAEMIKRPNVGLSSKKVNLGLATVRCQKEKIAIGTVVIQTTLIGTV